MAKTTNRLTVAASNVTGFVGNGSLGVRLTDGDLGVVINTDTKKFAAVASGNAALEGVDGLTVTGAGSIRINKLGEAINQTITTPDGPVTLDFAGNTDITQVRSTLNLQFQNFVSVTNDNNLCNGCSGSSSKRVLQCTVFGSRNNFFHRNLTFFNFYSPACR